MYNSILVPLDGSEFGEQALPIALAIAKASKGQVTLLNVWNPMWGTVFPELGAPVLNTQVWEPVAAKEYLEDMRKRITEKTDMSVQIAAITGGPMADAILEHAEKIDADLIVMTTHGRTGVSRAWMGSVANSVLQHSRIPVLLWRPSELPSGEPSVPCPLFKHVLIPLDGSPPSESVLSHAIPLGQLSGATVMLLRVVPSYTDTVFGTRTLKDILATREGIDEADKYLHDIADWTRSKYPGVKVDIKAIAHDKTAEAILRIAEDHKIDIIAMAPQASGLQRLMIGSTADKVLRGSHGAILMIRSA